MEAVVVIVYWPMIDWHSLSPNQGIPGVRADRDRAQPYHPPFRYLKKCPLPLLFYSLVVRFWLK